VETVFVAYVLVIVGGTRTQILGGKFDHYPTEEELRKIWDNHVERHTIIPLYINVEKHYYFE
jgi:hypothetical protein